MRPYACRKASSCACSSGVRGCCPCKCVSCCNCACAAADICSRAIRHNSWLSSHVMRISSACIASGTSGMVGRTAARRSRKTSSTGRCKAAAACWACSMVRSGKVSVMVVMGHSTCSDATSNSMCILAEGSRTGNGQGACSEDGKGYCFYRGRDRHTLSYRVRNATVTGSRAAWMAGRRPPAAPMLSAHTRPCASRLGVTRKLNATCEKVLKLSVEREAPSQ